MRKRGRFRHGFSLVELLAVIAILGLLVMVLLPALQGAREAARRIECANHLRQIMLGVAGYESARGAFPPGRQLPDWVHAFRVQRVYTDYDQVDVAAPEGEWTGFRSIHSWILPYLDDEAVYRRIAFDRPETQRMVREGAPWTSSFQAYASRQPLFLCPSDRPSGPARADNNYRYNFGGSTPYAGARATVDQTNHDARLRGLSVLGNGAFTAGEALEVEDFPAGLSKTVFFAERTRGSGRPAADQPPTHADLVTMPDRMDGMVAPEEIYRRCLAYVPVPSPFNFTAPGRWLPGSDYSNGWPFAGYSSTMYNHVAPPNWTGYDCGCWSAIPDTPGEHAIVSARSDHPGLVHAAYGDGHVRATASSIDRSAWRLLGMRDRRGVADE